MKSSAKTYHADRGVQMDATFITHTAACEQCRAFDPAKPATAGRMCLEGSVLYKRDNPAERPRAHVERPEAFASKAEVKRLMRYKGE